MAIVAQTANKEELRERIFNAVQEMYMEVAACPTKEFHFPIGREACTNVGYPVNELDAIPASAVESFAGVGYPFRVNIIQPGHTVLDVGSGAGTDLLIAAVKVGRSGKVYGLDFTDAMIQKANGNIKRARVQNVEVINGNAEAIPLPDGVCDVVTSNGVLNLVPDKVLAFKQIFRVLKQGAALQVSDIALGRDLSAKSRANPQLWAECIVGAVPEATYLQLVRDAGFTAVRVLDRFDYFAGSPNPSTKNVAQQYGAIAITISARKP